MGRTLENSMAEKEANEIAFKFMNSNDVVKDMSEAYNVDFSGINFHSDSSADSKVKSAGKDAIASGNDIFFGKGILESNDAASKGLVAHELAHTMQQGVVESSGVVSESVSEGAEQGGKFTDFFKKLFGKKEKIEISEPIRGGAATDQESLDYMTAMRLREKELKTGRAQIKPGALTKKELDDISKYSGDAKNSSNKGFASYKRKNLPRQEIIANSLVDLGYRVSGNSGGAHDVKLRNKLFDNSMDVYRKQMDKISERDLDFDSIKNSMKMYTESEFDQFSYKQYMHGEGISELSEEFLYMVGDCLKTDEGLEYLKTMNDNIKDADIFTSGYSTPINYMLSTVLTGEGIKMLKAAVAQQYPDARKNVFSTVSKTVMNFPIMDTLSDEDRAKFPKHVQNLYMKYRALSKELEEQIQGK